MTSRKIIARNDEGKEISILFKQIYEKFAVRLASFARAYIEPENENLVRLAALYAKDNDWKSVNIILNKSV